MVRWCSFGPCLTLWLDNWRRQVNIASWSTHFHLLFELPSLNSRIHMSEIMKFILLILDYTLSSIVVFLLY
jgi:hypothetical protein